VLGFWVTAGLPFCLDAPLPAPVALLQLSQLRSGQQPTAARCKPPTVHADLLNRLGLYLRSRKLSPDGQLKRFIQLHCQGSVVVIDS
jgi:hypothetical protein